MTEYYNIVPWYNKEEWHQLYSNIYSSTNLKTKEEALKLLLVWKARTPSLPSGIESTLTLLEVYLHDSYHPQNTANDLMIRLAYSTAIMRFVNHMLDSEAAKGTSLYKAAKNLGVPDWIVDLRHDTAHGSSLPGIELFREATLICLDWLKCNYWDKHKNFFDDYVCGQINVDENEENKISALMNLCVSLSICAHSKLNIKNLADIPDMTMRESIINDIQDVYIQSIDFSNLKKVSISSLINLMYVNYNCLLKSKNTSQFVNRALLGKDSLFLSLELLRVLSNGILRKSTGLSMHYIQSFEVLLTFLHTNDLLQDFILELINITQCSEESNQKRWLSAAWISEILKALKKTSHFENMIKKKKLSDLKMKSKKDLRSLYYHWFPSKKGQGLFLSLLKPVPQDLTDITFVRPIISSYNIYLTYFIKDILNLIEPELPSVITDKICKLAKLISFPSKVGTKLTESKVFTVHDVRVATEDCFVIDADEDLDMQEVEIEPVPTATETSLPTEEGRGGRGGEVGNSIWQIVSKGYHWSTCPIGKLPWDQDNDTDMKECVTYKEVSS